MAIRKWLVQTDKTHVAPWPVSLPGVATGESSDEEYGKKYNGLELRVGDLGFSEADCSFAGLAPRRQVGGWSSYHRGLLSPPRTIGPFRKHFSRSNWSAALRVGSHAIGGTARSWAPFELWLVLKQSYPYLIFIYSTGLASATFQRYCQADYSLTSPFIEQCGG